MDKLLTKKIMRRIYLMYVLRRATSARAVKLYVMLISTASVASLVSLSNVLANMPSLLDLRATLAFTLSAFLNTGVYVQLMVALFLGALVALGAELFIRDRSDYARANA